MSFKEFGKKIIEKFDFYSLGRAGITMDIFMVTGTYLVITYKGIDGIIFSLFAWTAYTLGILILKTILQKYNIEIKMTNEEVISDD